MNKRKNELNAWDLAVVESLVRAELMLANFSLESSELYRESLAKLLKKFEMANEGYTLTPME